MLYVDPRGNWHIIWHVYTTSPVPPTVRDCLGCCGDRSIGAPPPPTPASTAQCVNSTVSGHYFSPDGLVRPRGPGIAPVGRTVPPTFCPPALLQAWYASATSPFPNTIPITDGSTTLVSTRERPKILFDAAGDPTHLYNGVCGEPQGA